MKKLISILGSTGSIGLSTLKIIDKKKNIFVPYLFSADKNYKKICSQIKKYKQKIFLINNKIVFDKIKKKFKNKKIIVINNLQTKFLKKNSDITVLAIPGISGLLNSFDDKKSRKMLLANKSQLMWMESN